MSLIPTRKTLLAVLSGVMLTASFTPGKMGWIAWLALVPLLKGLEEESPSKAFRLGIIAGLAHYLTLIYWIIIVLKTYGGLNLIVSSAILLLLSIYLSLYPALFSVLVGYLKGARSRAFITAGVWVSLEYIRAGLLTGFPWCLLGYTQSGFLYLIQIADTVGVYGISFLIVLANALIYLLLFSAGPGAGKRYLGLEIFLFIALLSVAILYGNYRLSENKEGLKDAKLLKVAIIQANIDQSIKWDPLYQRDSMDKYRMLTETTYAFKPRLIVWPETAVPFFFQDNSELTEEVYRISWESGALIIFGSPAYERVKGSIRYYNRAYWLSGGGLSTGYYDKVHLVPFGEYVPLKTLLPFVHRLVPAAGDFASGSDLAPMRLPNLPTGMLICYEAIFPELSRAQVKKGASILVNITNDAWYGMTSAPHQHLSMSLFRAVENRRPMIRAANTGFSAFIDSNGRITTKGDLFDEEVLTKEVEFKDGSLTFYCRYGDIFVYLVLIICLIKFLYELCYHTLKKRKVKIIGSSPIKIGDD
jgi:apolipoprotein N-acyltransferase